MISRLMKRGRLGSEDGFTMIVAIGAVALVTVLSVAAFTAVQGELPLTSNDSHQQQAYAAAEAGIQQYLFDLDQDNSFWQRCVPNPANGINYKGQITSTRAVPGSSTESYAIELMPAAGQSQYTQCSTSDPVDSMIQASPGSGSGSLRIRVTGYSGKAQRTIVAQLRENTFLDYVWFTQYETDDPTVQTIIAGCTPSGGCPNGTSWSTTLGRAQTQCAKYWRNGRGNTAFYSGTKCDQIFFIDNDDIQGPMHTDDEFAICGTPTFGRNLGDSIEIGAPAPGESNENNSGCTSKPSNLGQVSNNAAILNPPSSNASLKSLAGSNYLFTGNTCISLQDQSGLLWANPPSGSTCESSNLTWNSLPYPSNGVIYVQNSTTKPCSLTYNYLSPDYTVDSSDSGCGTAYVHGTYAQSLTIGAENDIVVDGNVKHDGDNSLLGLLANNFVRVYHPVTGSTDPGNCGASNASGALSNPTIDAAIMSVAHSFIADNYPCGRPLGQLNIFGSIAQEFRGGVGQTQSGTATHGYVKNYVYDDRLRYEEPPHFLDPVQAAWQVVRQNECAPNAIPANPC